MTSLNLIVVFSEIQVPKIPFYDDIVTIFSKDYENLNWNSASDTFPKFVELLKFPEYTYNVMLGLICSIGGLTETLVKNSSSSLFAYMQREKKSSRIEEINRLCEVIYTIFKDHQKMDRITVPTLRFLEKFFSSGCIDHLTEDPAADFCKRLLKLILAEISGCKDIYKLIDGINLLAQFVQVLQQ